MKKLRLILWEKCGRNCEKCCNKEWNLEDIPLTNDYTTYDEILLTGGEPMLYPWLVRNAIREIRSQTTAPIYLYTALPSDKLHELLQFLDGITITLHEQGDIMRYMMFQRFLKYGDVAGKSLRLNVFKGVDLRTVNTRGWKVKSNMEWVKNCPLPDGEILMRWKSEKESK